MQRSLAKSSAHSNFKVNVDRNSSFLLWTFWVCLFASFWFEVKQHTNALHPFNCSIRLARQIPRRLQQLRCTFLQQRFPHSLFSHFSVKKFVKSGTYPRYHTQRNYVQLRRNVVEHIIHQQWCSTLRGVMTHFTNTSNVICSEPLLLATSANQAKNSGRSNTLNRFRVLDTWSVLLWLILFDYLELELFVLLICNYPIVCSR